jgi:Fungal specific transcription factor domain
MLYHCGHADCARQFVRQDLCVRHEERHSSQGSQLQKRDASSQAPTSASSRRFSSSTSDNQRSLSDASALSVASSSTAKPEDRASVAGEGIALSPRHGRTSGSMASTSSASLESRCQPPTPGTILPSSEPTAKLESSPTSYPLSPPQQQALKAVYTTERPQDFSGAYSRPSAVNPMSPTGYRQDSSLGFRDSAEEQASLPPLAAQFRPPMRTMGLSVQSLNSFAPEPNLPLSTPVGFSSTDTPQTSDTSLATAVAQSLSALDSMSGGQYAVTGDTSSVDLSAGFTYPIFGGEEYNRSPVARGAEFAAWLFNENQSPSAGFTHAPSMMSGYIDIATTQIQGPYYADNHFGSYYPPNVQPQDPMSVMSILDSTTPTRSIMSEEKRQELLDLMRCQFHERPHDAVRRCKDAVFDGDIDSYGHILSLRMLHSYIGSYFFHQHAQLPILHRPTFSADRTQNLLLLTVIAIGAATLDKAYGSELTDAAAEFANFIAWHVRWEIVRDEGYRPPAKLWVFQTLILLEVYEKMYSTRALHERAHINHDTTLTLMRRGTSFIGRTPNESPGSQRDGRTSGSNSASDAVASEESWTQWIRNEATRRIAFAAFVIDSIHATMFGHSAKMVAYEIHLPLPCDEALWSATSAAEVARVQSSHQTNGIKPTMFLDGLKKTLNGDRVRTNSFGRTILMSGLLSVNYLLNQRDLQITALSAQKVQTSSLSSKWRHTLLRAFDNWKKDFDDALAEAYPSNNHATSMSGPFALRHIDDDNVFESRTVLHHLAHMASCVDVFDCQTYAGARRLLGRPIGIKDFTHVREKMVNRWARTASARDAAYHALKFLIQVLVPPREPAGGVNILPHALDEQNHYQARDDFLLNRPWVLYFSALVVWCYGFALEGPLAPPPPESAFATIEQRDNDMNAFLDRVGGVTRPEDLEPMQGRNRCLGLLMVLRESLRVTRWELTHEAAFLLQNCIDKLMGKT